MNDNTYSGIYLGDFADDRKMRLRYKGPLHALTFGVPGARKSAGLIASNLAHLRQSAIVFDFKGQLTAITRRKREQMGRVVVLNPLNFRAKEIPTLRGQKWNSLLQLNPKHPNYMADCDCIADTLLTKGGTSGSAKFFDISATNIIALFVAYERVKNGKKANLRNVRSMLSEPSVFDKNHHPVSGFAHTLLEMALSDSYAIRTAAERLIARVTDPKSMGTSLQDVIDTAIKDFAFLNNDTAAANMASGSIDFAALRREIVTIYIVIPIEELSPEGMGKYLRLFVNLALRNLYRNPPLLDVASPPVLFIMDEFGNAGRFSEIPKALAISRDMSICCWFLCQNLSQLKTNYPEWPLFFTGAGATTSFRAGDLETAELLSKMVGNSEQHVMTENQNGGASLTPHAIPLIRPEDLMRLPPSMSVNWIAPCPYPIKAYVPIYTETPWAEGLDQNPYYRG